MSAMKLAITWFEDKPAAVKALEKISESQGGYYGKKVENEKLAVWVTSAELTAEGTIHHSEFAHVTFPAFNTQGTLGAPATEFAYATLKSGKTKEELDEVSRTLEAAAKKHDTCFGFSCGQVKDDSNYRLLYILGWDAVASHWAAVTNGGPLEEHVKELFKVADVVVYHSVLSEQKGE